MIDSDIHHKLIQTALSNGGDYADVFVEHRNQTSLVIEDSRLEKIVAGTETGAGIRLIINGKTAYAFSNDLSEQALLQAAREVSKAASGSALQSVLDLRVQRPSCELVIAQFPDQVPVDSKIALIKKAEAAARSFDPRIRQVTAIYRDTVQKVQIATSEGLITDDERVYTTAVVQVIASQDQVIQTGYESVGGFVGFELFEQNDIGQISLKTAERAIMMLSARKAPAGRMPVIISSEAGGTMIHEAIGHGLEADLAQQGLSVFSGKLNTPVASPLITVIDDATLQGMRGSFRCDDEGTAAQRTVLVQNGVLSSYMYDRLSSLKDRLQSTGNGRRESYHHRPIPRMTNTFIAHGSTRPEEIIRSVDHGLLVVKMGGGQVNTVTGDFVFEVQEGYLIRNGMRGEPVRGATLTGNGPQVLKSIDMVGTDLGFSIGTCGKDAQGVPVSDGMPTVRIPEIVVGGAY